MKKILFLLMAISIQLLLIAINSSSENYSLQQSSFATGNDPENSPASENYILSVSNIGLISDNTASSTNYGLIPGYYLGPIIGEILSPQNVMISVSGGNVYLNWEAVTNANSYKIYSSNDPNESFENWNLEASGIASNSWNQALQNAKKFYCIVASTESSTRNKTTKRKSR